MSEIKSPIHLSAVGGGGAASRFGIEDNTSDVDRNVDMQNHGVFISNASAFGFDTSDGKNGFGSFNGGGGNGSYFYTESPDVNQLNLQLNFVDGEMFIRTSANDIANPRALKLPPLWTLPIGNANYFPISVNGNFADATGNITIASTGGSGGGDMLLANYIVDEPLSGTVDGTNTIFTFANAVVTNKEMIFLNGAKQRRGVEYTMTNSTTATFTTAPTADGGIDYLDATYFKQ